MREDGLFPGATCQDNSTRDLELKQQQGLGAAGGTAGTGTEGGFLSISSSLMAGWQHPAKIYNTC